MEKSTVEKIAAVINNLINLLLIISMLVMLVIILKPNTVIKQMKRSLLVVVSGSMEPRIPKGSLIMIRKEKPENIEVGQDITFKVDIDGDYELELVTHTVAEIEIENGKYSFKTKPNIVDQLDDWTIPEKDILGVVEGSVPQLGYFTLFLHENIVPVLFTLNTIVITQLILSFLRNKREKNNSK